MLSTTMYSAAILLTLASLAVPGSTLPAVAHGAVPSPSTSWEFGPNVAAHQARKLYFGTATNNDELSDKAYFAILDNIAMFGQLTPAKAMKWV